MASASNINRVPAITVSTVLPISQRGKITRGWTVGYLWLILQMSVSLGQEEEVLIKDQNQYISDDTAISLGSYNKNRWFRRQYRDQESTELQKNWQLIIRFMVAKRHLNTKNYLISKWDPYPSLAEQKSIFPFLHSKGIKQALSPKKHILFLRKQK